MPIGHPHGRAQGHMEGRVAEQGTHMDLMAMRERYYTLYRQQEAAGES